MNIRKKMLVVDDDEINRSILSSIFKHQFQIETADSGEEALRITGEFKPDIVMLDIMMPGISGYEVCEKIRMDPSYAAMKVIMVSAISYKVGHKKSLSAGADDYVAKPFGIDEIRNVVETTLVGA
jgi:DNA-binding response OmpR family regulator